MKKQLVIIAILISVTAFSQHHKAYQDNEIERNMAAVIESSSNKKFMYNAKNTQGSPYVNAIFTPAIVSGTSKNTMMRYDVYGDEFEFIDSTTDTLVLNKITPFTNVTFSLSNTKYQLLDYVSNHKMKNGYLIWLYDKNNFALYKKQNIAYIKEKIATTSFDRSMPARFEKNKDTYYFKDGNKIIAEFPSNKKELIKLYPERKNEIETFLKQNKIDFDNEKDRIKIIDFLSA